MADRLAFRPEPPLSSESRAGPNRELNRYLKVGVFHDKRKWKWGLFVL